MTDKELKEGARNAIQTCLNVIAEDRVYILTDDDTLTVGDALTQEVKEIGAALVLRRIEEFATRPLTEVPEELAKGAEDFKPTVSVYAAGGKEGE
ncbi:MAG: hypothetical protein N2D54_12385, partial [Chloroflexota bacterium]